MSRKFNYENVLFVLLVIVYIFTCFHTVSMMVIAEPIMRDIHITASQIGLMSSSYFLFNALAQPFVGILTDKFGAKKIILASFGLTVITTILFAFSQNYHSAFIVRALMGICTSGIFIPTLKLFSATYNPEKFSKLNGIYMGLGGAGGAFIATIPLAYLDLTFGWRNSLLIYAIFGSMLVLFIQLCVKNPVSLSLGNTKPEIEEAEDTRDYKEIIKDFIFSRNFILLEVIFFTSFGVYISFQGLWATSYLTNLKGIDVQLASIVIFALPLGLMIGSMIAGYLSDKIFYSRLIPLQFSLIAMSLSWLAMTFYISSLSIYVISIILFIAGFGTGVISPMVFSIITDVVPAKARGITFGLINPSSLAGIFVFQIITSYILDLFMIDNIYTEQAYFMMMAFCVASLSIISILSFFMKETLIRTQPVKPLISFRIPKVLSTINFSFALIPIRFKYQIKPISYSGMLYRGLASSKLAFTRLQKNTFNK